MNKKTFRILILALILLFVFCLASCEQALSQGIHKHEWGAWETTKEATCTESGVHTRACKTCDETDTKETAPIGHDMVAFKDATVTCTENGYKNYKECSRCGHSEGGKTVAAGHKLTAWYGNTATCIKGGEEYAICTKCSHEETRATERNGHRIVDGVCAECKVSNILVLVENGKANFSVVATSSSGGSAMFAADEFVKKLRALGVEIADAVVDIEHDSISDCEIIIGANAVGRGEDCNVTSDYLGPEGQVIRRVGNKIVIAASTPAVTAEIFEEFVKTELGINESTTSVDYLETTKLYNEETIPQFAIKNITVNSSSLQGYKIVVDVLPYMDGYSTLGIDGFSENLYKAWGYRLQQISAQQMVSGERYFIIRYTEDAGDEGFRAYADGKNFVVECAYANKFDDTFVEFVNEYILEKTGDVTIAKDFSYEKTVNKVYYEEFGAVGDGETCDFEHIYNAHVFANQCGQKVYGKAGAVYYISPSNFLRSIPVKTDVDFLGATFIVNDEGDAAHAAREKTLFDISRDVKYTTVSTLKMYELYGSDTINIPRGTTSLEWLAPVLEGKSLVQIQNTHYDYIRHGANESGGAQRTEVLIVDENGKLADDTHVVFDYEPVEFITISTADDEHLTIENGNFYNICCKTVRRTYYTVQIEGDDGKKQNVKMYYANDYAAYKRGFGISRSNVTLKNITHEMQDEPELGYIPKESAYTPEGDGYYSSYGSRHESYPYYGFIFIDRSYNINVVDTQLDGHTTYYENKDATLSTGGVTPEPVPMGSYDFVIEDSTNITFKNVVQKSETGLGDSRYWGIMSSNASRNLTFENCQINRFDAHRGFWNATLKDTVIGHSFNVIGGGTLVADGVTKLVGPNFISLRNDYGATFRGDIILKNCTFDNYLRYNTSTGGSYKNTRYSYAYIINSGFDTKNSGWKDGATVFGGYWLWDFGYTCYMPENITFENFTSHTRTANNTYVFNDLPDIIFEKTYVDDASVTITTVKYPYQITKNITYIGNMTQFKTCKGDTSAPDNMNTTYTYEKLNGIPVHNDKDKDGICDTCGDPLS